MCYTAETETGGVTTEADTSRIFDVSGDVADDHVPQLDDLLDSSITAPEANLVTVSQLAPLPKTPVKAVAFAEPAVVVPAVAGTSGSAPAGRRGLKLPTFDSVFRRPGFQKARRTPAEQKKALVRHDRLRAKASGHARKFLTRDPDAADSDSDPAVGDGDRDSGLHGTRGRAPDVLPRPVSSWCSWLRLGGGDGGCRAPGFFSGRDGGRTRRGVEFFGVRAGGGHGPEQGLHAWPSGAGREEEGLEPWSIPGTRSGS